MRIPSVRVASWWRAGRAVLLLGCFLGAACGALFGVFDWIERAGIEQADFGVSALVVQRNRIGLLGGPANHRHVVFLGDSTVLGHPSHRTVTARLQRALRSVTRAANIVVHSLALPGLGPFEHYFASRAIAEQRPDAVVIAMNLASLSEGWRQQFSRPQLAGLLRPAQLPQALRLPLHFVGVTTDRLLLYVATVQVGGLRPWRWLARQQSRVASARKAAAIWLAAAFGKDGEQRFRDARNLRRLSQFRATRRDRFSAWAVRRQHGVALAGKAAGHPALEMLRAAIREFESRGVATLTYTVPLNVEHIDGLGLLDRALLQSSIDAVERAVRGGSGDFIDLHDLLPDEGYRDGPGHFRVEGEIDGPARVAAKLRDRVAAMLRRAAVPD